MDWELFTSTTIVGFVFLVCGLLWRRYPPKKINHIYGYRTRRSMANQVVWDYANGLGATMFLYLGGVLVMMGVCIYFLIPTTSPMISLLAMIVGIGIGMYWCETQLNKRFDKNGVPKNNDRI